MLTVPFQLRSAVAYDRHLLPRLYALFYDSIQGFYRRQLADHGYPGGRTGSATAVQRCRGDLRLNPSSSAEVCRSLEAPSCGASKRHTWTTGHRWYRPG